MSELAVCMKGIKKSFGGVHALKHVDLKVKKGSIHALVGENGAGKSTLMKVISGIYHKDAGEITINGDLVNFTNPKESQAGGVGIIHQELALSPDLTVAENIFLGDLGFGSAIISEKKLNQKAKEALEQLGFDINPAEKVGRLSVAYQQMVEIAKCLAKNVNILILDEPTAVLSDREIDILFVKLREFRDNGVSIIYISHRLEEIFRLCDAITVIKDGETITELNPALCTEGEIISNMVGREFSGLFPNKPKPTNEIVLEVENLSTRSFLRNINMVVRKGEIVGLSGLVGSGRTEIVRCLFGIDKPSTGTIKKYGKVLDIKHPSDAMKQGIGMIPESRKEQGSILSRPIRENITLSNLKGVSKYGIINHASEVSISERFKRTLQIKLGSIEHPISSLSGGNQQKVVIAKWLNTNCDVLVLDEPTRGVDVGAKAEIYNVIHDLTEMGYAIIVISSELPEIIGLCHRTYTMSEGQMTGELIGDEMTEENIMHLSIPKRSH
ncbi:sugar ABC transporter ATP-binding protein [Vibrio scophthalmi]|uniref:Aliphatic sulfonates import ATP-binding protein SsuB n=1 Tax=Vibrio scophthalmi TaxID=45658 RepID=A0A1E3WLD6_9VIBR|nr:sugar ABC transporter ATP-binding protein [Vibrio scophthalmi]ODS10584.1 Aliphatic sulfonates import ATP-binding protein SsuB [Vibrio scophthalmi]